MFPSKVNVNYKESAACTDLVHAGITRNESANARKIARNPEIVKEVMEKIVNEGKKVITPNLIASEIKKAIEQKIRRKNFYFISYNTSLFFEIIM